MFCIVGLGNPGSQYRLTRHNAGFLVIEHLAGSQGVSLSQKGFSSRYTKLTVKGEATFLVQPQTFMNLSGQSVAELVAFFKLPLNQLLVIYDDLDLPLGSLRVRESGSAGGHKGLASIIKALGTNAIPRIRIGIGNPGMDQKVTDYVLSPFIPAEEKIFHDMIAQAATAATSFITEGITYVMNHFNITAPTNPDNSANHQA